MSETPEETPGEKTPGEPSAEEIRAQLQRLERGRVFAGSERLLELLRYLVEESLAGRSAALREGGIGNAVYRREPPYDPRIDSTVRVEARRLRQKLGDYYKGEGQPDPVVIGLPLGRYVPEFKRAELSGAGATPAAADPSTFYSSSAGAVIAVVPFRALSRHPGDEEFADGLTDEVMFAFGRTDGLRLTSRGTTFQLKDRPMPLAALATELGVDAVLQGTVRREGDLLRISVELADASGYIAWTDRFDEPASDLLQLQERVATTLASRTRIDSSEMRAMRVGPKPETLKAHAKIYRARRLLDQQTPRSVLAALQIFEEVVGTAWPFARGYSGIADAYCDLYRLAAIGRDEARRKAQEAIRGALEQDPRSIEAHLASAKSALLLDWDAAAAIEILERAARLGENERSSRILGAALAAAGRWPEALRRFAEGRIGEPISNQQDIAEVLAHYHAQRLEELVQKAAAYESSRSPEVLHYLALAAHFTGESGLVERLLPRYGEPASDFPDLCFAAAEMAAWRGAPEAARRHLAEATGASAFARATLAAAVGEHDLALAALEETVSRRAWNALWIRTDSRFEALRGVPRFEALLPTLAT
jgi:TolB-like protein